MRTQNKLHPTIARLSALVAGISMGVACVWAIDKAAERKPALEPQTATTDTITIPHHIDRITPDSTYVGYDNNDLYNAIRGQSVVIRVATPAIQQAKR